MNNEVVFKALHKLGIKINEADYEFQVKSHPDYPSLLSVCDTLTFYNIENFGVKFPKERLDDLPETFITVINKKICIVSKLESQFIVSFGKGEEIISRQQLESRWTNFVLLINAVEKETSPYLGTSVRRLKKIALVTFCLVALYVIFVQTRSLETVLFGLTALFGIYLSFHAFKIQMGISSASSNTICGISAKTDCHAVISNSKSIFDKIKISDLSIWYFSGQFLSIFLLSLLPNSNSSLNFLYSISLLSIPVIFYSLYYQYRVEKLWCPICLLIIGVLVIQFLLCFLFQSFVFKIGVKDVAYLFPIYSFSAYCLYVIKPFINNYKNLITSKIESNRFIQNYQFFKNNLLSSSQESFDDDWLLIGNTDAKVKIVLISNLFCTYCKDVHLTLDRIYKKYQSEICIVIRFNFSPSLTEEQRKLYFRLVQIFEGEGDKAFSDALVTWFDGIDIKNWFEKYGEPEEGRIAGTEEKLRKINNQNFDMDLNFTPNIFLNGFNYPRIYDRNLLQRFIPDLIEDTEFTNVTKRLGEKSTI